MDERKIFDMIKKSGENVDAPEEIQPEQIRRLLEEQPSDKKKRFRRYAQWGAVAAVFALVIIGGVTGLTRLSGTDGKEYVNTKPSQEGWWWPLERILTFPKRCILQSRTRKL